MQGIVSDKKISDFRDLVNSNSKFVYQIYKDKGGKNLFNLVCSCMDWISVSVRYLENVPEFDSNIDVKCIQVYSLISSIDLILESVKQLHRVFVNEKTEPFKGEKLCFHNRLIEREDDNSYFKTRKRVVNHTCMDSSSFASNLFDHMKVQLPTCIRSLNDIDMSDLDGLFAYCLPIAYTSSLGSTSGRGMTASVNLMPSLKLLRNRFETHLLLLP